MKNTVRLLLYVLLFQACASPEPELLHGTHRLELKVNDSIWLPVGLIIPPNTLSNWILINGTERIEITNHYLNSDSLFLEMPVFPSYFVLTRSDEQWTGKWHNLDRGPEYTMAVKLMPNSALTTTTDFGLFNWNQNWKFTFNTGSESEYYGLGEFDFVNGAITGSVLKTSGDMRYLSGYQQEQNFRLFTFDGVHAYTLTGSWIGADSLYGIYTSGNHFSTTFGAKVKPSFSLPTGDTITRMKPEEISLHFSLPNSEGQLVSLNDLRFKDKAVVVQILGSWCPNCMDESRLLKEIYQKYNSQGLEVIGIALERSDDPNVAWRAIHKMQKDLQLPYPILFGGKAEDGAIQRILPEITGPAYYPTSLFLDKDHRVIHIHTGFTGPGTSNYPLLKKAIEDEIVALLTSESQKG